jgi:hypothetical protein
MSSGGSSHPAPPPGFTATSGVNRTRYLQYGPTLTVREPGAVITRGLVAGHSRPSPLVAAKPDTTHQTMPPRPLSCLLCAKPAGGYGVLQRRRAGCGAPGSRRGGAPSCRWPTRRDHSGRLGVTQ